MRYFHYKELIKVFAINCRKPMFESTKNSVIMFLTFPSVVALGFNIISPFSILRSVGIYSAFGASIACFFMSFKEDMHHIA